MGFIRDWIDNNKTDIEIAWRRRMDSVRRWVEKQIGKDDADTGKYIYDSAAEDHKKETEKYERSVKEINKALNRAVVNINKYKARIQQEQFQRLVDILSLLKDIEVPQEFEEETYQKQCKQLDSFTKIKTRDSVITIDFDRNPIKISFWNAFTFGIYGRKKGQETLSKAQEEVAVMKNEIAEMRAEIAKAEAYLESAQTIEYYFEEMSLLFDELLRYLEHAMNYIGYAAMRISKRVTRKSVSIVMLPLKQQRQLETTITLGKTLSKMIRTQIVMTDKETNLHQYAEEIKQKCAPFMPETQDGERKEETVHG